MSLDKFGGLVGRTQLLFDAGGVNGDFSAWLSPHDNPDSNLCSIAWGLSVPVLGCVPGAAPGQQFPATKFPSSASAGFTVLLGFVPKPPTRNKSATTRRRLSRWLRGQLDYYGPQS